MLKHFRDFAKFLFPSYSELGLGGLSPPERSFLYLQLGACPLQRLKLARSQEENHMLTHPLLIWAAG